MYKIKIVNSFDKLIAVFTSALLLIFVFYAHTSYSQQLSFSQNDTTNILNLAERSYILRYSNSDSAIIYAKQGIKLSLKTYYLKGYLQNLNSLSTVYFAIGEFQKSEELCLKTRDIANKFNFKIIEAMALNNLANIFLLKDNKTNALNYYLDALKIFEKNKYENGIKTALLNIGLIYKSLKLYNNAKEYLLKSITILNPKRDADLVGSFLFNYAVVLRDEGDFSKAKKIFIYSLKYWEKTKNDYGLALSNCNIGELEIESNNAAKGIIYLEKALFHAKKSDNNRILARPYLALGTYYFKKKNNTKTALDYLLKSYKLSKESNAFEYIFTSSDLLSEIYLKEKQISAAYSFLKESMSYQDSLKKSESKITVQNLQIRNDLEKNQEKLSLTEKDNKKNKLIKNIFIAGSFLLIIFLASLYFLYNKVVKQKKELQIVNATKDKLFSIISHELRSPFHILRGYLWMISNKAISLEQFQTASGALTKEVDNIFLALENLLNWAKAQMNGIIVKPVSIDAHELTEDILKIYNELAKEKAIQLCNNIPENLQFVCDRHHADLIIRNCINNALKFTRENGVIILECNTNQQFVNIRIIDNGIGIAKEKISSLFSIEKHFSEQGTKGEKGTGLGLLLCKEFIEKNNGMIRINSQLNKGTELILSFPAKQAL